MPKSIQVDEEIYIAPSMLGKYENGIPVVIDERNNNQKLDPHNIDHKIRIYEREVKEWFLEPASVLLSQNSFTNSFIVLMICMSYFEGVQQYKTGTESNRQSKAYFKNSIKRLYPDRFQEKELDELYSKSRCGLFHNGMVKGGVIFRNDFHEPIEFRNGGEAIRINPTRLLQDIRNDFESYIRELKNTANTDFRTARDNFDKMFIIL